MRVLQRARVQVEMRLIQCGAVDALGSNNVFPSVHKAVISVIDDEVKGELGDV